MLALSKLSGDAIHLRRVVDLDNAVQAVRPVVFAITRKRSRPRKLVMR